MLYRYPLYWLQSSVDFPQPLLYQASELPINDNLVWLNIVDYRKFLIIYNIKYQKNIVLKYKN